MNADRRIVLLAVGVVAGLLVSGRAAAQSYGTGDQVLTVGAVSFIDEGQPGSVLDDGYFYGASEHSFSAPVALPVGAEVTQICLYARNLKPGAFLQLDFQAVKLAPGGLSPGIVTIPNASVTTDFATGYDVRCTGPLSYTFHGTADVDGDGTPEHVAHRFFASFNQTDGTLAIGGVRITWHRQVSPPPATPTFGDVPTSHPFFQYVEALAASGITAGCGGGDYCPDSPVTRGQMAVFLAKALGLHWPN